MVETGRVRWGAFAATVGWVTACAVLVGWGVPSIQHASSNREAAAVSKSDIQPMGDVNGRVLRMDFEALALTLQTASGEVTLKVNADTTVFCDGKTGTVMDLKAGQDVRVLFERYRDGAFASWVELPKAPVRSARAP